MPLGLDLSQSDAKIARARVHLESLKGEIAAFIVQRKPYSRYLGEIDPETGWCSIFIKKTADIPEHTLGIIVGDVVHNLRSALDYIVVGLVAKSPPTRLAGKHQFPIYSDRQKYLVGVGTDTTALPGGALGGIVHGLKEIWDVQPFHRK